MAGAPHIVAKDVRRLRWLLVLWVAVLASRVAFASLATGFTREAFGPAVALQALGSIAGTLETLLLALLVARLVHDEPLVGLNAFWLTRPYSRGSLLSAKLAFAGVALVLFPVVADLVTMALFGAGAAAQLRAATVFLSSHLVWMLSLFVLAVLTPSFGAFSIAIMSVAAALSLVVATLIGLAAFSVDESETYLLIATPDPTPEIVGYIVLTVATLSVIVYQYRHRRLRIALAIGAVGLASLLLVPWLWPWPFARPAPVEPGAWASDASRTPAVVDRSVPMQVNDVRDFSQGGTPRRHLHAPVRLTGMPADTFTRTVGVRGTLMLADGTTLRSRQASGFVPQFEVRAVGLWPNIPLSALGDVEILTTTDVTSYTPWPALLAVTEEQHAAYRGQAGTFEGEIDFPLLRARVRGTLPLTVGAAVTDAASRIELVRVERRGDAQAVAVRRWQARSLLDVDRFPEFEFVLLNRTRQQVLTATQRGQAPGFGTGGNVHFSTSVAIPLALLARGSPWPPAGAFSVQTDILEFPTAVTPRGVAIQLEPEWLDEAELVVLSSEYAGTITRPLTIENFVIPN